MVQAFQPLSLHCLESGTGYFHPKHQVANSQPFMQCVLHDPAVRAMTDFSRTTPCLIELSTPIGDARAILIQRRIRMLLVHDANDHMIGLLTGRDLEGDKPERILAKAGGAWDDLKVADLMTIRPKVQVVLMKDVLCARIGDIIATLRQINRQHALVVDTHPDNSQLALRGVFSLSQIALQLGLDIDPTRGSTTYADLEKAGFVL